VNGRHAGEWTSIRSKKGSDIKKIESADFGGRAGKGGRTI
jgi:hypothetical protein